MEVELDVAEGGRWNFAGGDLHPEIYSRQRLAKRGRFTEEQIIAVLRAAEGGTPVKGLCRRAGVSMVTFHKWKMKFEGMEISEMRRMRLLEDENSRLIKIVAQQALDIDALKVVLSSGRPAGGTRPVVFMHPS